MAKKSKTVKELYLEFELLSERIKKFEEKNKNNKCSEENNKIQMIENILKSYDDKTEHLNRILEQANTEMRQIRLDCKVCEDKQTSKVILEEHMKDHKPIDDKKNNVQSFRCKKCDENLKCKIDLKNMYRISIQRFIDVKSVTLKCM